ncbi:MAG TPA: DegQ family serine endoprotease [Syntrophales bacterium]|nr:DegQ family serine endoprotease [Syntrophales bacterium]
MKKGFFTKWNVKRIPIFLGAALFAFALPGEAAVQKGGSPDLSTAIIQVAKGSIPAVVHIEVTRSQEVSRPTMPFEGDPFFRFFQEPQRTPRKFKREMRGLGTGMIIDAQGYILTNNHVVGGASKVQVLLADGSQYSARVVGTDSKTDLAVVTIDSKKALPHLKFGNSDTVEVGEWVVAIGHPRGLDQTVTTGIISAKHRRGITDPSGYQDFLQTDAAINPGNSGGPLLNLRGEVVGVNAAIASSSGGFEGIGFAIPSNMAVYISRELISKGKVERGWLGVSVQDLSYDLSKTMGIEGTRGALVSEVMKGSPAEKAGLKQGDVVIAFNGKEIRDASQLRNEAASTAIGKEARVTVLREGKIREIPVRIESMQSRAQSTGASIRERLGVTVRPPTAKESGRLKLQSDQGVIITRVEPGSPGAKAGLEPGDVILEINEMVVTSPQDLSEALALVKPGQHVQVMAVDQRTGDRGSIQIQVR